MRVGPAQCLILATLLFFGSAEPDARAGVPVSRSRSTVQQEGSGAPAIDPQPPQKAGPSAGKMEIKAVCEPEISSLAPAGEVRAGVTVLTLSGKCFGKDRGRYSLAVKPAGKGKQTFSESSWSDREIRFTLPALPELTGPESTTADLGIVFRSTKKWKDVIRNVPVIGAATPAGPRMTVKTSPAADPGSPKQIRRRDSGFLTGKLTRTAAPAPKRPGMTESGPFTLTSPADLPPGTFSLKKSPAGGSPQFGSRTVVQKGGGAGPQAVPRPGEMPGVDPSSIKDSGLRKLPPLELQVRQGSGDFASWGHTWQENMPFIVDLRWRTFRSDFMAGTWELSSSPSFKSEYVYAKGYLLRSPGSGKFRNFSIDLREVKTLPDRTYFYVAASASFLDGTNAVSYPVILHIGEEPEQTSFGLTRLTVVFDEVEVKDDSDDSGEGELNFAFWVQDEEPKHFYADVATDESRAIGISYVLANPPQYVTVGVAACDDDDIDVVGDGPPDKFYGLRCGQTGWGFSDGIADKATGTGMLVTGTAQGHTELGITPFTISAFSESLWFRIHGRYWMTTEQ